jgi:hypothetical protein
MTEEIVHAYEKGNSKMLSPKQIECGAKITSTAL